MGNAFREWPTWAMLIVCYGLWCFAGLWMIHSAFWGGIALMAIATALHASLQHEALHGHPTRKAWLNEALVCLPLGVFFPYRRFKQMHLRHHCDERLTDPYDDPESFYRAEHDWHEMPTLLRATLSFNNTLIGRILIGPAIMVTGFLIIDAKRFAADEKGVRLAWAIHVVTLVALYVIVTNIFALPFLYYVGFVAYPAMSLIAIRTFCEHQWSTAPDGRTIIVENSRILSWLFLHNSFHLVHHAEPTRPWYELPARYRQERKQWLARNNGYAVRNYIEIARHFAFRAKEPVAHPALRRQALHEPVAGQIHGFPTTAPHDIVVPAKPQIR